MITLEYDADAGECDLVLSGSAIVETDPLRTSFIVSLFTDRRVSAGELPEGVDRGGWWGETYPQIDGDAEGSRLWTLPVKGRADALTARECEGHARECLQWALDDGIVTSLTVAAAVVRDGVIGFTVRAVVAEDQRELLLQFEVI